jgi:hypothetical protein
MNIVGNRNFAWPIRNCSMHPKDPVLFLLGWVWGVRFWFFPMSSPPSSHFVLNMFLKFSMCSSKSSQQHFILSRMLCPRLSSWNVYGWERILRPVWFYFGVDAATLGSLQSFIQRGSPPNCYILNLNFKDVTPQLITLIPRLVQQQGDK